MKLEIKTPNHPSLTMEACFPTYVGFDNYANAEPNYCERLVAEVFSTIDRDGWKNQALWKLKTIGPLKTKLEELTKASGNAYAKAVGWDGEFELGQGWINCNQPGSLGSSTPHAHTGSHFVCVFYPLVAENCGDLLLQDPRGGVFCQPSWDRLDQRNVDCRVYQRFTPKIGDIVFFPGFMVHSVEVNQSRSVRISFATNFRQKPSYKTT